MIDTLTSTPFFGLGVTLLCWYLAVRFQKRTGLLICNPVLVASLLVIGIMLLFHIPLDNYNAGGSIIKLLRSRSVSYVFTSCGLQAVWIL